MLSAPSSTVALRCFITHVQGFVPDLFADSEHFAITVVPAASVDCPAHLIVCRRLDAYMHVFVLPSLAPVLVHTLATGTKVVGLGADPAGTTLIVCDQTTRAMTTLTWPLPGMHHSPPACCNA